uniref:Uncharacterized protein n=1 Tax=Oryza punctata TaxID=4537 RepID=A0A0E0LKJ4_ORYPU
MDERPALPPPPSAPQSPPFSAPASPYSALHPLLLPSPNPHLLLKPKTLTLSLSSSSLGSMPSSSPPGPAVPDAWELVTPTTATVVAVGTAAVDDGLDDCDVFLPRLHEGLGVEGEAEEAAAKEGEEDEEEDGEDFGDGKWLWGWGRCRAAARRAWAAGVGAVRVPRGEARRVVGGGGGRCGGSAALRSPAGQEGEGPARVALVGEG